VTGPRTDLVARLTPYDDWKGWLRGVAVTAAFALFMTVVGAFGTGDAPLLLRATYWLAVMFLGYLWGGFVARRFFRGPRAEARPWWKVGPVVSAIMAAPFTLVVWASSRAFLGSEISAAGLPVLFGYVFVVALVITGLFSLIESRRATVGAFAPPTPKFLERLPLKLRGAEVWAVEAEDHYLRLHTSKGQDLILMRLADAVAELEGIEGLQVHRSWWVARDAITSARRGDGRATLTLKDGAQVPVSRTYAGELRERGWI
jgi:DNA-binding LytR/AlgR family response regulator